MDYSFRIGQRKKNNRGRWMTIIEYRKHEDIDVQFDSGYVAQHRSYSRFKDGGIKDLYEPIICGVGYVGGTEYSFSNCPYVYDTWRHMLNRCYKPTRLSYMDCTVCEEWHNFQNFAKWYLANNYDVPNDRIELDKDLSGARIYSPETCYLLPGKINTALACKRYGNKKMCQFDGVFYNTRQKRYETYIDYSSEGRKKKCFTDPHDAAVYHFAEKEKRLRYLANEYREYLPKKVYDAVTTFKYKAVA